ncbi:MAG: quinolinate synthase NadA [Clostridia bacterium]|nr:quinolinate synthase NadA [Clostridia bacterium]
MDMETLTDRILRLKKERNALLLAHYYQNPEVQDIADIVGDSFELARRAQNATEDVIVLCGVRFMAETAKLLNPGKTVLLPVEAAGCPMAEMVSPEDVIAMRRHEPSAAVVCYVNSSVDVKAESDVCCTSSNAVRIVRSLPNRTVIMLPDKNLADYVARAVPGKVIVPYPGFCPTHRRITVMDVENARRTLPGAPVLVHPECEPSVVDAADFAGSTAQILRRVVEGPEQAFLIGTEWGVLHAISKAAPGKTLKVLSTSLTCTNMKKIHLEDIANCLENHREGVQIPENVRERAMRSVVRMMEAADAPLSV